MEFTPEFKLKVYECLKNHVSITDIMKSLEENDDLNFRFQIEIVLDSLDRILRPRIIMDTGDMELWNGQVRYWLEMNSIYADFMEMVTEELDRDLGVLKSKDDEDFHH